MNFFAVLLRLTIGFGVIAPGGCVRENPAGPPAADERVFSPSGKEYLGGSGPGQPLRPGGMFLALEANEVAAAAQIYADFSQKEVRVPQNLLDRKLSLLSSGQHQVNRRYVVKSFDWILPADGVEIVPVGRGVVAFRAGKTAHEKQAQDPRPATSAEIAAATAAMREDGFWTIIERARRSGGRDCFKMAAALETALSKLSEEEILGFQYHFSQRMKETYRWDLWAVAYIVNGGASDDGFEYFCCWLIAQGREYFQSALKNPERAADRAGKDQQNECEQILYSAMKAYKMKTNRFPPVLPHVRTPKPVGEPWNEEQLSTLYPDLVRKFR